ncbi:MAG: hypothetical protein M1834_002364 [Cirrosporium novae-zelandiae]|nr:MAG: hypothetical protein M1834_002364 [Cirrosporium novae-zelandiae]
MNTSNESKVDQFSDNLPDASFRIISNFTLCISRVDRVAILEERVEELSKTLQESLQNVQDVLNRIQSPQGVDVSIRRLSNNMAFSRQNNLILDDGAYASFEAAQSLRSLASFSVPSAIPQPNTKQQDLVAKGIITEAQCSEMFNYFRIHCSDTIAFFDNNVPPFHVVRGTPLLLAAMCTIGARAARSVLYQPCMAEATSLLNDTIAGPPPSLAALKGIMLIVAWHRYDRLWGYIMSISYELGLHTAALGLKHKSNQTPVEIDMARTWLTFCCFDLIYNMNRTCLINKGEQYGDLGPFLLSSPYYHTVDYRIAAYLKLFNIASNATESFLNLGNDDSRHLPENLGPLLSSFNEKTDEWFYNINNNINPLYQTFSRPQDRNRMLIPYSFVRMYINGFVLHNISSEQVVHNPLHLQFIHRAVEAGKLLLRSGLQSASYQSSLKYTIDYSSSPLSLATNFLFKAIVVAHRYIDVPSIVRMLDRVRHMFQEAGATRYVADISRMLTKISEIVQLDDELLLHISPSGEGDCQDQQEVEEEVLYDIVGSATEFVKDPVRFLFGIRVHLPFVLDVTRLTDKQKKRWHQDFPFLNNFAAIERHRLNPDDRNSSSSRDLLMKDI